MHPGYHEHISFSTLFGGASVKALHHHIAYSVGISSWKKREEERMIRTKSEQQQPAKTSDKKP